MDWQNLVSNMKQEIVSLPNQPEADKPENVKKVDDAYASINDKIKTLQKHTSQIKDIEQQLDILDPKQPYKDADLDGMPEALHSLMKTSRIDMNS